MDQHQQQPYDSSIKAIFKEDAAQIVPRLLKGAIFLRVLDLEILRPPMRADRAYGIEYEGEFHIFQMEFQAGEDEDIEYRALVYHAVLLRDFRKPVITMIIYLFKSSMVKSPFREMSGNDVLLLFHYKVLGLWTLDAREYVREHDICLYTLLPAMAHATADILFQAIDELIEHFKHDETKLAYRLLWFGTFLRRTDMVTLQDKEKVGERLDTFENLLEQDEFVKKQRVLGEMKGKAEGKVEEAQGVLVKVVSLRFPSLANLARQRVTHMQQLEALDELIGRAILASDEATVRTLLSTL